MRRVSLMSVDSFKKRSVVHTNTDVKLIQPWMLITQDTKIMPLLGSRLYDKLQSLVEDNQVSDAGNEYYKELLDEYVIPTLEQYILSKLAIHISNQFSNTGMNVKQPEGSSQSIGDQQTLVSNDYRQTAQYYATRCKKYLDQYGGVGNGGNHFPEYLAIDGRIDQISPEKKTFNCPIYLGDTNDTVNAENKTQIRNLTITDQAIANSNT